MSSYLLLSSPPASPTYYLTVYFMGITAVSPSVHYRLAAAVFRGWSQLGRAPCLLQGVPPLKLVLELCVKKLHVVSWVEIRVCDVTGA